MRGWRFALGFGLMRDVAVDLGLACLVRDGLGWEDVGERDLGVTS